MNHFRALVREFQRQVIAQHVAAAGGNRAAAARTLGIGKGELYTLSKTLGECRCGHFSCVCPLFTRHVATCRFFLSVAGAAGIVCEHGFDSCPKCDPCTCPRVLDKPVSAGVQGANT